MKQTTNTRKNINVSQKHYAEEKKPHTKDHILYDAIYMKFYEKQNYSDIKWSVGAGAGVRRGD